MHFANNLTSVLFSLYPEGMTNLLPVLAKESLSVGETVCLIAVALISAFAGLVLLGVFNKKLKSIGS